MGSFVIYTAPGGFTATAAGADTDQAKVRPLTLNGPAIPKDSGLDKAAMLRVGTVKHSPSEAQYAAWTAEKDAQKRAAILATMTQRVIKTGKVQVTTAALAEWQTRTATREAARAALTSGVVVLSAEREDDTEDVLASLFAETPEPTPEPIAEKPEK